jgi:hypothetical protein
MRLQTLVAAITILLIGAAGCSPANRTAGSTTSGVHRGQADGASGNLPGTRTTGSGDAAMGRPGGGTIGVP